MYGIRHQYGGDYIGSVSEFLQLLPLDLLNDQHSSSRRLQINLWFGLPLKSWNCHLGGIPHLGTAEMGHLAVQKFCTDLSVRMKRATDWAWFHLIDGWSQSSTSGASATKPVPIPPKKNKNAVGVQRKISNITDELASVPPMRTATNQPAEAKGSVNSWLFVSNSQRTVNNATLSLFWPIMCKGPQK